MRLLKKAGVMIAGVLALLLAMGAGWERLERRQAAAAYPPPGRMVDIGGRRMQIECRGAGSPTVVFETGLDYYGELAWAKVLGPVSRFTRACAYSRAGMVSSDDKPALHDGLGVAHDLHATLAAAGEHAPLVLVGLSLGGPYISLYTGLYGDEVAGLVYVDAAHPDQRRRTEAVLGKLPNDKALIQDLGGKASWTGLPRLVTLFARNSPAMSSLPASTRTMSLAYFPSSLRALSAERDAFEATLDEAGAYRDLGSRPVVVLSHGQAVDEVPQAKSRAFEAIWRDLQIDMAHWSSCGVQRTVGEARHYIPQDDPDAVVAAVREVVDQVRAGAQPKRAGDNADTSRPCATTSAGG